MGYSTPRLLIAFGIPLDDWLKNLPSGINYDVAYWLLIVIFAGFVISLTYLIPYLFLRKKELAELPTKQEDKLQLQIDFDEDNPKYLCIGGDTDEATYVYDSVKYRIGIRNKSKTQTIKNVEVRITYIAGCPEWLSGKIPIILNYNGKETFDIHPNIQQPIDVVMWHEDTRWDGGQFVFCANKKLQIPNGDFIISLNASGENATCEPKDFIVSLKYKESKNEDKISMKNFKS